MLYQVSFTHGLLEANVRVDQVWTLDWSCMVFWREALLHVILFIKQMTVDMDLSLPIKVFQIIPLQG